MADIQDSPLKAFLKDFTAGQFAGMAQTAVGHPLDTIKVRLQTQPTPPIYSGAVDCFRQTLQSEGPFGFFKGMLAPLFVVGGINACLFAVFGQTQKFLVARKGPSDVPSTTVDKNGKKVRTINLNFGEVFLCGAVAGTACSVIVGPMELIKTQLQINRSSGGKNYEGTFKFGRRLVREHGIMSLRRGMLATVFREIPAYGAFYGVYFTAKQKLAKQFPEWPTYATQLPAASLAGWSYWLACYPLDVGKSLMQSEQLGSQYQYTSVGQAISKTYAKKGLKGLYPGLAPAMVRAVPAAIATFVTYEVVMDLLEDL